MTVPNRAPHGYDAERAREARQDMLRYRALVRRPAVSHHVDPGAFERLQRQVWDLRERVRRMEGGRDA